jgi:phytoene synthase
LTLLDTSPNSYCAAQVRRLDRDRYLTALFAPAHDRAHLLALYAFNLEVARAHEMVREPMMGRIRLQWWRERLAEIYDGKEQQHQVARSLAQAIRTRGLSRVHFDRLIDAREADFRAEPPADMADLLAYADATSGGLGLLAREALGAPGAARTHAFDAAIREIWTSWALIGLVRAVAFHARDRRVYLPLTVLGAVGASVRDVLEMRRSTSIAEAAKRVVDEARGRLDDGIRALPQRPPRRLLPVLLPATLARDYLRRLTRAAYDPFDAAVQGTPTGRVWRLLLAQLRGRP